MEIKDFIKKIKTLDYPIAMYSFAEGENPTIPFLVYQLDYNNFSADGNVYITDIILRLYLITDKVDFFVENQIEKILHDIGYFEKEQEYIEDEKIYQTEYTIGGFTNNAKDKV